jgi:hypothetical protein
MGGEKKKKGQEKRAKRKTRKKSTKERQTVGEKNAENRESFFHSPVLL